MILNCKEIVALLTEEEIRAAKNFVDEFADECSNEDESIIVRYFDSKVPYVARWMDNHTKEEEEECYKKQASLAKELVSRKYNVDDYDDIYFVRTDLVNSDTEIVMHRAIPDGEYAALLDYYYESVLPEIVNTWKNADISDFVLWNIDLKENRTRADYWNCERNSGYTGTIKNDSGNEFVFEYRLVPDWVLKVKGQPTKDFEPDPEYEKRQEEERRVYNEKRKASDTVKKKMSEVCLNSSLSLIEKIERVTAIYKEISESEEFEDPHLYKATVKAIVAADDVREEEEDYDCPF